MDLTRISEIKAKDHSYNVIRLLSQFEFALNLLKVSPDKDYQDLLEEAIIFFLAQYDAEGGISNLMRETIEASLEQLSRLAKDVLIHCVGHAHIDMNWMWGYEETVAVTLNTMRTVIRLMDTYPDFTFSQSQASIYEIVATYDTDLLTKIKEKIHAGRWEVTASFWTESDKNMPSPESLIHHIIYTKKYLADLLDMDPNTIQLDFEPDTFGHPQHLPEILAKGGIKYYYFCRGKERKGIFYWRAPSQAKVLAYQEPIWYNAAIDPYDFAFYPEFLAQNNLPSGLKVYGVGDHGGGPTIKDIDLLIDMNTWPLMPKLQFSSYQRFFAEAEATSHPVFEGEMNPIFAGCYTSQSLIKEKNKAAERALYVTEVTSLFKAYDDKDEIMLERAWKDVLFNQFHDILTGSGKPETRDFALGKYQNVFSTVNSQTEKNLDELARHVKVPESFKDSDLRYVVFNPIPVKRESLVELVLWDFGLDIHKLEIEDANGHKLSYVVKDHNPVSYWSHNYQRIEVWMELEAFSYQLLGIRQGQQVDIPHINPNPVEQAMRKHSPSSYMIENDLIQAIFDRSGTLVSLIDKSDHFDYVSGHDHYGLLRLIYEDATKGMTAWNIGQYLSVQEIRDNVSVRNDLIVKNPLFEQFGFEFKVNKSKIEVIYQLKKSSPCIDIEIHVDWREIGDVETGIPALEYAFRHSLKNPWYQFDQGNTLITRVFQDSDVFANNFALARTPDKILIMINKDNYGYRANENTLSAKLLRSSIDPDKYPEVREHHFHIGIIVSNTIANSAIYDSVNSALYKNLVCRQLFTDSKLPNQGALIMKIQGYLLITTLKRKGEWTTMRVMEVEGKTIDAIFEFNNIQEAWETDYFGNHISQLSFSTSQIRFQLAPFQIKTLTIQSK